MPVYTTVRGRLRDAEPKAAMETHNTIVAKLRGRNAELGGVGHRVFANAQDPQEFLALDTWDSMEGLQQAFSDPETQRELGSMFDGAPEVTIWSPRDGWTAF